MDSIELIPQRERESKDAYVFRAVTEAFCQMVELPGVGALNMDPQASRAMTLNAVAIEFIVDVKTATTFALRETAEQKAWFALVAGEDVPKALAARVIKKCAAVYFQRGLTPGRYFSHIRRGGRKVAA